MIEPSAAWLNGWNKEQIYRLHTYNTQSAGIEEIVLMKCDGYTIPCIIINKYMMSAMITPMLVNDVSGIN